MPYSGDYPADPEQLIKKGITWSGAGLIIVFLLFAANPIIVIPAGHVGILQNFGRVVGTLDPGLHIITPIVNSVQMMDLRTQKYEVKETAATQDLLDVTTSVAINYRLNRNGADNLYQTVGVGYENTVIAPQLQETLKAATAKFNAQELISNRPAVMEMVRSQLQDKLTSRGLTIESVAITNFEFPAAFNDAIVAKQTAVQKKQQAENDLQRIEVEAQQAIAKATGESEAIKIINSQLERSKDIIPYTAVMKWDGKLPLATGGGAVPFINLNLTGGN